MSIPTLEEVCAAVGKHPKMVHGCYVFGSRVYGTASADSDWDFILIANASAPEVEFKNVNFNIHILTPDRFAKEVRDNHIRALECICAPEWAILKPAKIEFIYKPESFRHNISHTVSNSWVKCKKKLAQDDYYIGIKSLFHSLRIAHFGIQYAKTKTIDYSAMNWLWNDLDGKTDWTWEELKDKYQDLRNELLSEFRKYAEKTIVNN
jgi:predicted nucleotidyltransferase